MMNDPLVKRADRARVLAWAGADFLETVLDGELAEHPRLRRRGLHP